MVVYKCTVMAVCAHAGKGSSQTGQGRRGQEEFRAGHMIEEREEAKDSRGQETRPLSWVPSLLLCDSATLTLFVVYRLFHMV